MQPRNVLLGKLWIWFTVIFLILPAVALCFFLMLIPLILGAKPEFMLLLGVLVPAFFGILSVPGILVGRGLMTGAPWAKVPALILSVLIVGHFPVGTALAVYTFVVLLDNSQPGNRPS